MAKPLYTQTRGALSAKHYKVFGHITVEYASLEVGLKLTLAGYIGRGIGEALVLSAPYNSTQLRNVMKAMTRFHLKPESKIREIVTQIIGTLKGASVLRNDIGHNMWRKGDRPQSIAPTYMEIRNDKAELKGFQEENRDYTFAEIEKTADALWKANHTLAGLHRSAEFQASLERYISHNSQPRDVSEGIS